MKFEIRTRNPERLDVILKNKPDIVGVGDEGCFYRIPSAKDALAIREKVEKAGAKFRFVTPKATQNHVEEIIEIVKALSGEGKNYHLTVNDIGFIYGCYEKGILPEHVTIGRTLSKSLVDCKWHNYFLDEEEESVRRTLYQNYMSHKTKIDFLKDYGVGSIELSMVEKQEDSFNNFVRNGWEINIHYGLISMGFSRVCQTAKYYKVPVPQCIGKCEKRFEIEMSQIWDKGNYLEMSEELKEINPSFVLIGNVLYRENPLKLSEYDLTNVNGIILGDAQCDSVESIKETFEMIKEAI
jgi:hypothetical protein